MDLEKDKYNFIFFLMNIFYLLSYTINMKKFFKFIIYTFSPALIGFISSLFFNTKSFKTVIKPKLAPPAIVFPIAWTILYILMGFGLYLTCKDTFDKKSFKFFLIQYIINITWSFLFFNFKLYAFSAIWILLLIYTTSLMMSAFYQNKKLAGYLQIPYFIWLLFALYLNVGVAILN